MKSPSSSLAVFFLLGLFAFFLIPPAVAQGTFTTVHDFTTGSNGINATGSLAKASDGTIFGTTESGGPADRGTIYKVSPTGVRTAFYSFRGNGDGRSPNGVVLGVDGALYGTLNEGGTFSSGAFFRVTQDGVFTLMRSFYYDVDGSEPSALILGPDGNFYGTARSGGTAYSGTIFKVTPAGVLTVLYYFGEHDSAVVGDTPETGLVLGNDGNFYGITTGGGANGSGTFFKITSGGNFTKLADFSNVTADRPEYPLVKASDGNFYGANTSGGTNQDGSILRITPAGVITDLHDFDSATGNYYPSASLVEAGGLLYGSTQYSGADNAAALFSISPAGIFTNVVSFGADVDGYGIYPSSPLLVGNDGRLYATYYHGLFASTTAGVVTSFSTIGFNNSPYRPAGNLARAADGTIYGTTLYGGTNGNGAAFKLTPAGVYSVIADFDYALTGAYPSSGLILGADGNFYGTCTDGYYDTVAAVYDNGTVFKMTPAGVISVVHAFTGAESVTPDNAIMQAADGNFYGTTTSGGLNGDGIIYKVTAGGVYSKLFDFEENITGGRPQWKLVQGGDGALYGVVSEGATYNEGGIFRISPDGTNFSLLHRFIAYAEGSRPTGLFRAGSGLIYGTLQSGGLGGNGLVYQISTAGVFTGLHAFSGGTDGGQPFGFPTQTASGDLFGNTEIGGANNNGTIYKLTPAGEFSIVGSHPPALDTYNFHLELVQGTDGLLYGASSGDGANGVGNLYRFNPVPYVAPPPPPPPVVTYIITALARPPTKGTVSGGGTFAAGSTVTLRAKPKAGKKFLGWKENGKFVTKKLVYTVAVQGNHTLQAFFQ